MLLLNYNPDKGKVFQLMESSFYKIGIAEFLRNKYSIDHLIDYLLFNAENENWSIEYFLNLVKKKVRTEIIITKKIILKA